jgi:protocatechuate 3,4-dioxygenase beta subunit
MLREEHPDLRKMNMGWGERPAHIHFSVKPAMEDE